MTRSSAPRIAVLGMAIESSAYAQHRAGTRDFAVLTGDDVLTRYPFLRGSSSDAAFSRDRDDLADRAEWLGVFYARSIPGGQVRQEVYEAFRAHMLDGLSAALADGPLDALYLDLHGAMSVEGMDDAEGDLVTQIRGLVGERPLISAPMDLHGNLSERFVAAVDLPTCFRMAPHEDAWETRRRAAVNLLAHLDSATRPRRAWVAVPILLPGEKTSTRVEPARSLYARLPQVEALDGVTDASIWIGYAWADEPRCHASVLVSGDDVNAIRAQAERLAHELWEVRESFDFVGPPGSLAEGIARAIEHRRSGGGRPYLVSDSGDNPGAGGSGDVTWTLHQLLADPVLTAEDGPLTYVASIFDRAAIEELEGHAEGDLVEVTAGARIDDRVSGPVTIRGRLIGRHTGDPDAGRIVVIGVGGLRIVLTEHRKAYHAVTDFAAIGLPPQEADIIVTKIGYLEPTLYEVARGWTLALTPGPVDQDLQRLGHRRIRRPMFPFDRFDADPALDATVY